ncbi:thioredoxin family protein [Gilvibacter sp.]|uniref:protein-disulfide reductase DsbD family protein n=1 Tax=Gilvibacter sp. TaxID=2729997 RepID=UPI0025BF72D2|nr:thioredoxin family protein [Gilvibacter sp.]NQX77862.1 thioredoxin family protein [Gilvibacter sp.]
MARLKYLYSVLLVLLAFTTQAQVTDPIKWTAEVNQQNGDTLRVTLDATIIPEWYTYAYYMDEGGPIPTEISYEFAEGDYTVIEDVVESEVKRKYDETFEMEIGIHEGSARFTQSLVQNKKGAPLSVVVDYQSCDAERCIFENAIIPLKVPGGTEIIDNPEASAKDKELTDALVLEMGNTEFLETNEQQNSGWKNFLLGFLGGLIALLTPCVFPMIPLTVSFFTKGSENRKRGIVNAVLYGLFIALIYVLLSVPFHVLDSINEEILNTISTNVTLNVVFFVIFLVFAFSLFGYFELTLPSSWGTKMDQKATSLGGVLGIFFMAITLAIVSFSCTGPILGTLLGNSLSSDGGAWQLTYGIAGFGLALALPFALFAMFPNWLNSLPKSGGWMTTVKVVLGFLELGFAFKFLSNADLVSHWGLLKREVFLGTWILLSLALAAYLFGFIKFPHDGPRKRKAVPVILGVLFVAFAGYMSLGIPNPPKSNLPVLSGFAPPMFYSVYDKEISDIHGEHTYTTFEEGVAAAKRLKKPIIIDFTGWACVNCRKMEEQVWVEPEVKSLLHDEYVLLSLYVDDREVLPETEQFNFVRQDGSLKSIRNIGNKWATFQTVNFKNNSQPYYVLMDADLNLLNTPIGYTPDASEYAAWLKQGLEKFKEKPSLKFIFNQ